MGTIKNIRDYISSKPAKEIAIKVICALCISTLVILIIISCARGTKAEASANDKENSTTLMLFEQHGEMWNYTI